MNEKDCVAACHCRVGDKNLVNVEGSKVTNVNKSGEIQVVYVDKGNQNVSACGSGSGANTGSVNTPAQKNGGNGSRTNVVHQELTTCQHHLEIADLHRQIGEVIHVQRSLRRRERDAPNTR